MSATRDASRSNAIKSQQYDGYGGPDRRLLPDDAPFHPDAFASQEAHLGDRFVREGGSLPEGVTLNGR